MKTIEYNDLLTAIKEYMASQPEQPLLVWFRVGSTEVDDAKTVLENMPGCTRFTGHPFYGHKRFFDATDEQVKTLASHPEIANSFRLPSTYKEGISTFFLYFTAGYQLEDVNMNYVKELHKNTKLPVICLVEDDSKKHYAKIHGKEFDHSGFEEWEVPMRGVDEW